MNPAHKPFGTAVSPIVAASLVALWFLSLPAFSSAQDLVRVARADGNQTALRVYAPAGNCPPLAIISPGAGGTENGYTYLARGLQDQYWLAIVVGHKESGPSELRHDIRDAGLHEGIKQMVTDAALHRDRIMDVAAALQWANASCKRPYRVLLGHSMGSDTVMFEAGATNQLGIHGQDRFDAYVAISPSGAGSIFTANSWSGIHKPLFVLTGTRDKGIEGPWQWRTQPFDALPPGCKWLGVINGATHLNFAGIGLAPKTEKATLASVTAFLTVAQTGRCPAPSLGHAITIRTK